MDSSQNSTHEPSSAEEKKTSRRPANTAFRQQRLKAWQPILTPKNVIWIFFVLGVFAAVVGGLLIYASRMVSYLEIDYTDCGALATTERQPMPAGLSKSYWRSGTAALDAQWEKEENVTQLYNGFAVHNRTRCTLQFTTAQDMSPPVRAYYHLDNFYQNHRRYVNSFNAEQLLAHSVSTSTLENSNCAPLATEVVEEDGQQKTFQIYPCGLIANSLFNDTIGAPVPLGTNSTNAYEWNENNIAWDSDKDLYEPLTDPDLNLIIPPPNWRDRYPDGRYTDKYPPPNLKEDEHFISWMRTAALPSFFKPWAFGNETLVAGTYSIDIIDNFNMTEYKGKKSLVITTTGPLGGKNDLPGILWLALSGFFILMSLLFVIGNFLRPRKLGDHTLLSWNKAPPSAAAKGKGKATAGPSIGMSTGRDM
ncbi:putative lem3 cdc50 family protein [Rosellinia necatrix]|uniref:Putative lem3 cdc50 family protein n=1 Tax=Rosellinia necatrix TaxID=77044 RepID=A0A1W2TXF4_ROSNE|nr:putative lem3 cdc50 family protein [Rosellinia necatrix]